MVLPGIKLLWSFLSWAAGCSSTRGVGAPKAHPKITNNATVLPNQIKSIHIELDNKMINLFTLNMISERVYVERGRRKSSERLLMVLESQHDDFSALLGQRATTEAWFELQWYWRTCFLYKGNASSSLRLNTALATERPGKQLLLPDFFYIICLTLIVGGIEKELEQ